MPSLRNILLVFFVTCSPLSAATYTFKVDATSSSVDGFVPTSFELSIVTDDWSGNPPNVCCGYDAVNNASVAVFSRTKTPWTDTFLGLIDETDYSFGLVYMSSGISSSSGTGSAQFRNSANSVSYRQAADGNWYYDVYNHQIALSKNISSVSEVIGSTDAEVRKFLEGETLYWTESVSRTVYSDEQGRNPISELNFRHNYRGTATLLAPVPLPATGLLLLAGLGGLGLVARRRKFS